MVIYICLGGCVILSALWILSVLLLKRIGSSGLSRVIDFVVTISVIGMFALGTYLYINQQYTLDTQAQTSQNEHGKEQDADGEQIDQLLEIATPAQEPLPTPIGELSS